MLLGSDNGDPTDTQCMQDNTETDASRNTFHGAAAAIVQADREAGEVTITVSAEGLKSGTCRIAVGTGESDSLTETTAKAVTSKAGGIE